MDINETFRSLNVGLPQDILRLKIYGDFDEAVRLIDQRLARPNIPQGLRSCMTAQREMMLRTPPDYPYSREEALALVRERIPDFTPAGPASRRKTRVEPAGRRIAWSAASA